MASRVRLTGDVPMSDEEFGTLADRAGLLGAVMLAGVLLVLWLALKSFPHHRRHPSDHWRRPGPHHGGRPGMAVGVFNIISIAFIALFVGLGSRFRHSVRGALHRHERFHTNNLDQALSCTGKALGAPLALAAGATAAGFFSFIPTTYTGVAELGEVAGMGMIMAFLLSVTLLPALLKLMQLGGEKDEVGFAWMAPADRFLLRHRRAVVLTALGAGIVSLGMMYFVRFDSDPLDLRSPKVESVSTLRDLMSNPQTSPNTIDIPAPSLKEADALAETVVAALPAGWARPSRCLISCPRIRTKSWP